MRPAPGFPGRFQSSRPAGGESAEAGRDNVYSRLGGRSWTTRSHSARRDRPGRARPPDPGGRAQPSSSVRTRGWKTSPFSSLDRAELPDRR
jgi:hypothetical protein